MYLPLIKLSLVFLLFFELKDELERKLLQNFMSLFTRHEPRGRRERDSTKVIELWGIQISPAEFLLFCVKFIA